MKNINVTNFSKIYIGTSNTNELKILLTTKLKLSNNFVTEPFGTTRMRFQYPEMFIYSLKQLDDDKYELTITRSDKILCPVTAKYFWNPGWKLELFITNVQNDIPLTKEIITQILPYNYADININTISKKFNVGIIVPLFSRYNYVKRFFSSLINTNLTDCLVILVDESTTKDVNEDKMMINLFVSEIDIPNCIKIFKKKHGNMFDSILRGCDVASIYCDKLITIDSDTIHKKDWVIKSIEIYDKVSKSNKNVLLSPFNTINAKRHLINKEYDNYYTKYSVGGCCLMFSTDMYYSLIRFTLISHKWDTNITTNIKNNGGLIIVTKPSLIDHIGFESSGHRIDSEQHEYDIAVDFFNN